MPEVVRHAHTGEWVAAQLRARISGGSLLPGAKLPETTLAAELDVSRNTLREAFGTLAAESVVHRVPNRGVFVAAPDADDVREIYRVRRLIEPAALLWGERREAGGSEREALAGLPGRIRTALAAGDVTAMADANQRLHGAVVGLSGSESLTTLMSRTLTRMRLVFHGMSGAPDFHRPYAERNLELLDLIAADRWEDAAQRLRGYLDAAEAELLAWLA